ncbi:hypothetical protein PC9H_002545 [Pleurotus ostreatus]|uniref:Uncharacterized protein n=1 Tax=Pleurotus ostreatus TaxID=5322 RepID=A0A8H7DNE7_PLEOS|nr:uncharacterized protein PC9H_002545 [Pleurotus ostreatus]KAF7416280.1 hypothetical protein PC9H_002545 [Pleurotus ostreatus]
MGRQESQPNGIHHSRQLSAVPRAVSMIQVPPSRRPAKSTQSVRRTTPLVANSQKATKGRSSLRAKSLPAPQKDTRTGRLSAAPAKRKATAASTLPSVRGKPTAQRPAAAQRKPPPPAATIVTRSRARRASAPPEVVTPQKRKVFDGVVIDVNERQISVPSARAKRLRIQPPPTAPRPPRKKVFDGVEIPSTRWMTTWVASEITVRRTQCPPRPSRPSKKKIFDGVEVDCLCRCYAAREQFGTSWGNLGEDVYSALSADHVSTPGAELETDSQSVHSDDLVYMGSVDTAQPA